MITKTRDAAETEFGEVTQLYPMMGSIAVQRSDGMWEWWNVVTPHEPIGHEWWRGFPGDGGGGRVSDTLKWGLALLVLAFLLRALRD